MAAIVLLAAISIGEAPRENEALNRIVLQLSALADDERAPLPVRVEALRTLGKLGHEASAATTKLIDLLDRPMAIDQSPLIEAVVATLGQIGPPARNGLPTLARLVGRDIDVDLAVRRAIDRILAAPEKVELEVLLRQMRSKDASIRLRAAKAVAAFGTKAEEAVPDLINLTQDPDADVRRLAVAGLRAVQPELRQTDVVVQAYLLDLREADEATRINALKQLAKLGPAAAPAAGAIQRAQSDSSADVRRAAGDALSRIAPP